MLWGSSQVTQFKSLVVSGYANTVLAFNEPDLGSQSNLDPGTAAKMWMQDGQPLRQQGYSTIAPAVAFSAPWLTSFFKACTGCKFDAMAAHIYATSSEDVINYLTGLHNQFQMPLWVTEFACQSFTGGPQCTESQVTDFATNVTQWMDETDFIVKYFPYGVMTSTTININPLNALMNADGTPNALAGIYFGT